LLVTAVHQRHEFGPASGRAAADSGGDADTCSDSASNSVSSSYSSTGGIYETFAGALKE